MLIKTKAIVLKAIKYGDSSLIVHVFTEAIGLRTYIVNGVRKPKSTMPSAIFQVGNAINLIAYEKNDAKLQRIKEVSLDLVYQNIPFDIRKGASAMLIMEIVGKCVQEVEPNERLFRFLYEILAFLDETTSSIHNFHLFFMLHFCAFLGFSPNGRFFESAVFDLKEGNFIAPSNFSNTAINTAQSNFLFLLLQSTLLDFHKIQRSRTDRDELFLSLELFYMQHVENLRPFESYRIWKEMLQ